MAAGVEEEWESALGLLAIDNPHKDKTAAAAVGTNIGDVNPQSQSRSGDVNATTAVMKPSQDERDISTNTGTAMNTVASRAGANGSASSSVPSTNGAAALTLPLGRSTTFDSKSGRGKSPTTSSPKKVTTAPVPSASPSLEGLIDPALLDALENAKGYVLKLEEDLVAFVNSKEQRPHIYLSPRSSYQRLIAYRLSARFKLQKATPAQEKEGIAISGNGVATAPSVTTGGKEQRATVFMRAADSEIPTVLLSTVHAEKMKQQAAEAVMAATVTAAMGNKGAPIKLMRRSPNDPRAKSLAHDQASGSMEKQVKTVEDREREYAEARARIFGTKITPQLPQPPPNATTVSPVGSPPVSLPNADGVTPAMADASTAETGSPSSAEATTGTSNRSPTTVVNRKSTSADVVSSFTPHSAPTAVTDTSIAASVTTKSSAPSPSSEGNSGAPVKKGPPSASTMGKASGTECKAAAAPIAGGRRSEREVKQAGGAITSQGPDGTPGFGRGRGKPLPGRGDGDHGAGASRPRLQGADGTDRDKGNGTALGDFRRNDTGGRGSVAVRGMAGRGNRKAPVNAGEWKGQRGVQRNRVAEKSDPDFVRNYDNYRPSFAPYRQLADPSTGGFVGGHGQPQQQPHPPPRLLQQHQAMGVIAQHGPVQHMMLGVPGMPGHLRSPISGQAQQQPGGIMLVQHQQWQQAQMEAQVQAMAASGAAAGGGVPAVAYSASPAAAHGIYTHGFPDPTQAAAAAAGAQGGMGMIVHGAAASAVAVPGGAPGSTMAHQLQQSQQAHSAHQGQQLSQPQQHGGAHPHSHPNHLQQITGYMIHGQHAHGHQVGQQHGVVVPQNQQQAGQLLLQQQHMQSTGPTAGGVPMSPGGYMAGQDFYGAQAAQQAMYYHNRGVAAMAQPGYGAHHPQQQQQPQVHGHPQQQQQQQAYGMSLQQAHGQQPRHNPFQHQVHPVGAMQQQQQPLPQQRRMQPGGAGRCGGRHAGRSGNGQLMGVHAQHGSGAGVGGGGRTVPNRGYQNDFPPLG